jgi:hypothetical protein
MTLGVWFFIGFLLVVAIVVQRRRKLRGTPRFESGDPLAGTHADPAHPGVAWMFPGRGTPTAQDVRETAVVEPDRRPKAGPPPGIRRDSDAE